MKKLLFVLTIIVVLSLVLSACGSSGGTPLPGQNSDTHQPAVGEKLIEKGINEFFQNKGDCSGLVC